MQQRCLNPNHKNYHRYGGAGVTICKQWCGLQGRDRFMQWALENGWKKGLVIDRIGDGLCYSPTTVRIVTQLRNNRNKVDNRQITYLGETKCVADWAEDSRCLCKGRKVFSNRITMGWTMERAFNTQTRK